MTKPVSQDEVEAAIVRIIQWVGEDPVREGLVDTPERVARAWKQWCGGYEIDPVQDLSRTFREVEGYDEMVVLAGIRFVSHCEHHLAPIIGQAHVGYLPSDRVVGISKLARVVDAYARRLQVQEKMTAQIARCIEEVLQPRGVAVVLEAEHLCISSRGTEKPGAIMVTSRMLGLFRSDPRTREEFLQFIAKRRESRT